MGPENTVVTQKQKQFINIDKYVETALQFLCICHLFFLILQDEDRSAENMLFKNNVCECTYLAKQGFLWSPYDMIKC